MAKIGWKIDRDYLAQSGNGPSRVGKCSPGYDKDHPGQIRFRTLSDDGDISYGGWLYDDDYCNSQEQALDYAMADAGDTTIEVKRGTEWKQEIG